MIQAYYCKSCKYYTIVLSNYKVHLASKKHAENCTINDDKLGEKFKKIQIFCCNTCDNFYMSNQALKKHKEKCAELVNTDDLINEIKELKHELETKTTQLISKETQLDKALDIAKESSQTANTSMNMLKYAQLYLPDVQPFEALTVETVFLLLGYKNPKNLEAKNETYVKMAIHKFDHGKFSDFIGNMIVEYYKPKSPKDANLISTDTSRMCFIIMQKIPQKDKDKTEQKEWINDKSGKRFTELVLKPLFEVLKETLTHYVNFKNNGGVFDETIMELQTKCITLRRDINVGKFTNPILKYVGPFFQFDKLKLLNEKVDNEFEDESPDEKLQKKSKIIVKKSN